MKFLSIVLACVLSGLTGLLFLGCSGTGEKKTKLAFVTNNASDFWTIARKGVEQTDKELPNVDVEFRIPADGTAAEQKRIVDDLLRSEEHTSELQSLAYLVCRLLLEKKKKTRE